MHPDNLRYTRDHEWIGVRPGGSYAVGITHHAQDLLGDITYVELPKAGRVVKAHEETATVESVKAASDIYAPVSGTVLAVNEKLDSAPELVNQEPHGEGWFFTLNNVDEAEYNALMDAAAYEAFLKDEAH